MQYQNNQNCCSNEANCFTGCGQTMPIVPGYNPSLNYWNGQAFVVADGSAQNPIILPFLKTTQDPATYFIGADNNGRWSYYNPTNMFNGNNIQVTATGSTTARTLANRFADVANVKDFGAIGNGSVDDTDAIQRALNSGASKVFIPPSPNGYKVRTLIMPTTAGFVLQGSGTSGFLKMAGGSVITWPSGSVAYVQGSVNNIAIDGTNGTNYCIDTSYVGGVDFNDIYIKNLPTGYGGVFINGNSSASEYSHDIAINRIRIYDNGSGAVSGIVCGPFSADVEIYEPIMNLNFITDYCIYMQANCGSVQVLGGHPYNAKVNIVRVETNNVDIRFDAVTFDNSYSDLVYASTANGLVFNGCRFQAVNSGHSGLYLANCLNTTVNACEFDGAAGSVSMVVETGTSNFTIVSYPNVTTYSNFSSAFNLIGSNSFVRGAYQNNLRGYFINFPFCAQSLLTAGSTVYLGPNGQQNAENINRFVIPIDGLLDSCTVVCSTAAGAGQSYTATLALNGTTISTGTLSGASQYLVNLTIPANTSVPKGTGYLTLQVVASAGAASTIIRGFIAMTA